MGGLADADDLAQARYVEQRAQNLGRGDLRAGRRTRRSERFSIGIKYLVREISP
jgi:hypothetical protein